MTGDDELVEVLARSRRLGLLGPGPVEDHVRHAGTFVAAAAAALGGPPARFVDLGTGGGVPGLVLALRWPDATGLLVDGQLRRVRFLTDALEALGADARVEAVHARAEELAHQPAHRGRADLVTARSFGPPAITAECGVAFLRPGGVLLVAEPPDPANRWPEAGLATLGLADEGITRTEAGAVRHLRLQVAPPASIPRRGPAMRRRPRF